MTRRDSRHDYRLAYSYMITFSLSESLRFRLCRIFDGLSEPYDFSRPRCEAAMEVKRYVEFERYLVAARGRQILPVVELTDVGCVVRKAFTDFFRSYSSLKLRKIVVMPDHIHFIITVKEYLERHLGEYIGILKGACTAAVREFLEKSCDFELEGSLFEEGFHDRIIRNKEMYEREQIYLDRNPRRRLCRQLYPEMRSEIVKTEVAGVEVACYGNLDLLERSIIDLLVVRSRFDANVLKHLENRWRSVGREGGAVVSPFFSQKEKEMRKAVIEEGGSVIQICQHGFGERYKPSGEWDELLLAGRLLQIGEPEFSTKSSALSRSRAMGMNRFAARIARSRSKHLLDL